MARTPPPHVPKLDPKYEREPKSRYDWSITPPLSVVMYRVESGENFESYAIFAAGEKGQGASGLAIVGDKAYVALPGLNVVRVIDLKTGQKQADWPLDAVADIGLVRDIILAGIGRDDGNSR